MEDDKLGGRTACQREKVERRLLIALLLTSAILVMEALGGLWTGSLALLSDAAHVLLDLVALMMTLIALRLSARPATDRHSYGFHRFEVLSALVNGATLALISGGIFIEAFHRLSEPVPVKGLELLLIAIVGLFANLGAAAALGHGVRLDLNVKSAFLHVLGDAASSAGVVVAAVVIWRTGWTIIDPLMSIAIGLIILSSSWRVVKSSLHILLEGVPQEMDSEDVTGAILEVEGVRDVHDLHIWNLCSNEAVLTAHVVISDQSLGRAQALREEIERRLSLMGIDHTTIQLESKGCGKPHCSIEHGD